VILPSRGSGDRVYRVLARDTWNSVKGSRLLVRNFYGALRVFDEQSNGSWGSCGYCGMERSITASSSRRRTRGLRHHILCDQLGSGLAILHLQPSGSINVGVIGLGSGTLATYGRTGDHYTFYDINPLVPGIAPRSSRSCPNARRRRKCAGDARLSLEREPSKHFDVLAVDAFRAMRFRCTC